MKIVDIIFSNAKMEITYFRNRKKMMNSPYAIDIMTIDETIAYMSVPGHSIVRYGDGEFMLMNGKGLCKYQDYNELLGRKLRDIIINHINDEKLLVCMPEPMAGIDKYTRRSRKYWTMQLTQNEEMYKSLVIPSMVYGNSFVSRPYIIYRDKSNCAKWFDALKAVFEDRDIVIIEGEYSRSGVGNDLFGKARSVKRILGPCHCAFTKYEQILGAAMKIEKDRLILVAIGPAGKPITEELSKQGYWVLDIGHIDSEYEWFLSGSVRKKRIGNKHTADISDVSISECGDIEYIDSIIAKIV